MCGLKSIGHFVAITIALKKSDQVDKGTLCAPSAGRRQYVSSTIKQNQRACLEDRLCNFKLE